MSYNAKRSSQIAQCPPRQPTTLKRLDSRRLRMHARGDRSIVNRSSLMGRSKDLIRARRMTRVVEAVGIVNPGLKKRANEVREAATHISMHPSKNNDAKTYKAIKANASSVFFKLHLLTKNGELTAHPPL